MSLHNFFNEQVMLRALDLYNGLSIRKSLNFLLKSQYWTYDKHIEHQNHLLNKLIEHSYKNVPYYRDIFDKIGIKPNDIKTQEDLKLLPILTKEEIRTNIKNGKLIAQNFKPQDLIINHSSGSTGEPLQFFQCKNSESMKKASAIRGWYWMNFRLGDKILRISPIPRKGKLKSIQDFFTRTQYLHIPKLNNEAFDKICKSLKSFKPKVLRIYPDPLLYLSKYIINNGININFVNSINTTGSILTQETRYLAEKAFNCKVYDSFSCEGGAVVFESPQHNCYYSAMEYAITEVLDSKNNSALKGCLVTTDLCNYATPFIRYNTQDVIELFIEKKTDGFGLMPIKTIYGRESDVLVTNDNQLIIVNNFTGLFQSIKNLEQFQVHQQSIDRFTIYIKCSKQADLVKEQVLSAVKNIFPSGSSIEIECVKNISAEKSGKRRFLVRDKSILLP
jgi:phenylacetate-CoA ligase